MSEDVQTPMTVKAQGGAVTFDGRFVTITRGRIGTRTIPVNQISGVDVRLATLLTAGAFTLVLPGAVEHRKMSGRRNDLRNENTVIFQRKSNDDFLGLRDAILAAL